MLNEYLNRIQAIIADLRAALDDGGIPDDAAAKIREYLDQLERIAELYKEP